MDIPSKNKRLSNPQQQLHAVLAAQPFSPPFDLENDLKLPIQHPSPPLYGPQFEKGLPRHVETFIDSDGRDLAVRIWAREVAFATFFDDDDVETDAAAGYGEAQTHTDIGDGDGVGNRLSELALVRAGESAIPGDRTFLNLAPLADGLVHVSLNFFLCLSLSYSVFVCLIFEPWAVGHDPARGQMPCGFLPVIGLDLFHSSTSSSVFPLPTTVD